MNTDLPIFFCSKRLTLNINISRQRKLKESPNSRRHCAVVVQTYFTSCPGWDLSFKIHIEEGTLPRLFIVNLRWELTEFWVRWESLVCTKDCCVDCLSSTRHFSVGSTTTPRSAQHLSNQSNFWYSMIILGFHIWKPWSQMFWSITGLISERHVSDLGRHAALDPSFKGIPKVTFWKYLRLVFNRILS